MLNSKNLNLDTKRGKLILITIRGCWEYQIITLKTDQRDKYLFYFSFMNCISGLPNS